ncbi:MAG: hypothetical protein WA654_00015 [Candidatus Sulfotelmatobacter sp.]
MQPTTTATVIVYAFQVSPAVFPVTMARMLNNAVGIAMIKPKISVAIPTTMPAPMAITIFIPM